MLCCPDRSPLRSSSRLDGGILKSSIRTAALTCVSRIVVRFSMSRGNRRVRPVVKNCSVSALANDRIISLTINNMFINVKGQLSLPGRRQAKLSQQGAAYSWCRCGAAEQTIPRMAGFYSAAAAKCRRFSGLLCHRRKQIPHRKPSKDCRFSELSVWVSGLESKC